MIIVHDTFVCKPGEASKTAKLFREVMGEDVHLVNVMTDVTGQFHRVIMVSKYESLAEYEKLGKEMMESPTEEMKANMKKMEGFNDRYLTGSRDIFRTW